MRRPLRPCKEFGCKHLVRRGYCDLHQQLHQTKYKHASIESKREYDKRRPTSRQRGYDTNWDKFRRLYLRKHPLCHKCQSLAVIPHHIEPLPYGSKYDEDNLMPLCIKCHNKIHHGMNKNLL